MTLQERLAAFGARIGITGLVIIAAIAFGVVQTARVEGFKVWPISITGLKQQVSNLKRDLRDMEKASKEAAEKARAVRLAKEREYAQLAKRIDDEAEQAQADAMDAAERFIRDNSVRCQAVGNSLSRTRASPEGGGAESVGQPRTLPKLDGVLIPPDDVRICTENTVRLQQAQSWAFSLLRTYQAD